MDETTTVAEELNTSLDVDAAFDKLYDVVGFFRKIIDFLKGIITPIITGALDSILGSIK